MEEQFEISQDEMFKFLSEEPETALELAEEAELEIFTEVKEQETTIEEVIEPVVQDTVEETESFKALQVLIKTGQIEDVIIDIEGKEVQLSEFKDLDEDTLKDILNTYKEEEKSSLKSDYVKIKDLDESKKALIDIVTKGNLEDLKEFFKDPSVVGEPYAGYDYNNDTHNIQIYGDYLMKVKGHDEEDARALVDMAIKNLTIDKKALAIVESTKVAHVEILNKKALAFKEAEKLEKENIKNYTKDLSTNLQSYELKPEKVLEITKIATQKDANGDLLIDNLYEEMIKDPKRAVDLILFITDKELYNKLATAETKFKTEMDIARKIKIIPDSKSKATAPVEDKTERSKTIASFLNEEFTIN